MPNLERFKAAQDDPNSGFQAALAELQAGHKKGHWIWYVFPQLAGLGSSWDSRFYAVDSVAESVEYLHDRLLSRRLLTVTAAATEQLRVGVPLLELMGSHIDALKLVSSLTLFGHVAHSLHESEGDDVHGELARAAQEVLAAVAAQGYPPCRHTLDSLGAVRNGPRPKP